uniref:BZIP domain-containing protein n=1 Tax=Steinernema glaseri TaxID=37863 RepID=A0A1I7Z9M8_9BILA
MPSDSARKRGPAKITEVDDDYQLKRQRNNAAVNKTRQKQRAVEDTTMKKVRAMRKENADLERQVESLQQELKFLKEMFVAYASKSKEAGGGGGGETRSEE